MHRSPAILLAAAALLTASVSPSGAAAQSTPTPSPARLLDQGVADLRAGRVEAALEAMDRLTELDPPSLPYLWQRGIAQYFAGQYREGREQFEAHRSVNPHDVENATWHFLCVAAVDGVAAARRGMLPAPGDSRVPMREVYALYAGTGDRAAVEAAVEALPVASPARRSARFYADLYLGLLAHAEGNADEAARYLRAAAAVADRNVMTDVARVAHQRLVEKQPQRPAAAGNAAAAGNQTQPSEPPTKPLDAEDDEQ